MYNVIMALDITVCIIFGIAAITIAFIVIKKKVTKKHKEQKEQKLWDSWIQHPKKANTLVNKDDKSEFHF